MLTIEKLYNRAIRAINKDEHFIYDIADNCCQIVDNVKHMQWFVVVVMQWLIDNTSEYSHLSLES